MGQIESDTPVDHCPRCRLPAHASETNDDGVCAACLGDEAIAPEEAHRADDDGMAFADSDDFGGGWPPVDQRFDVGGEA